MSREQRFRARYASRGSMRFPIVRITFRPASRSGISMPITENFKVDTGFTAALKMPMAMATQFFNEGLSGFSGQWTLADGKLVNVIKFAIEITKLEGEAEYVLPSPIQTVVGCMGVESSDNLVGLEVLNKWIAELHGPQSMLSIYEGL